MSQLPERNRNPFLLALYFRDELIRGDECEKSKRETAEAVTEKQVGRRFVHNKRRRKKQKKNKKPSREKCKRPQQTSGFLSLFLFSLVRVRQSLRRRRRRRREKRVQKAAKQGAEKPRKEKETVKKRDRDGLGLSAAAWPRARGKVSGAGRRPANDEPGRLRTTQTQTDAFSFAGRETPRCLSPARKFRRRCAPRRAPSHRVFATVNWPR